MFVEKNADGIIALFTVILAGSTIALWGVTRVLAEHIPIVERAYVSGGFGGFKEEPTQTKVFATINNYGKTPAFITRVALDVGFKKELPQSPTYPSSGPSSHFGGYEVPPAGRMTASHVWAIQPPGKDGDTQLFYGRIWYRDIFGDEHSSGFILDVWTESGAAVDGFPKYWDRT